ncbi:conserved protein of unknown function [Pseudorhizobium banfieldiae]|jgi:hypothetical protein|uniref:Glycosyltransferase n=2 Tax=Pseudorhizobium banfieldiae TaxID=1125847 RepID=L0NFZ3_9HYPH|nr:glycosyl transferase [arsenite-oxidising bacterium NT-25]CCF20018.1 conserved protein of unknown function [Pseudorhizobium banfieldiae]
MASSNPDDPVNVICMKWGTLYGPDYVNNLFNGVTRHLRRPHRFVCFTDDASGLNPEIDVQPLPLLQMRQGETDLRWRKLSILAADLAGLAGPTLFLDLDLVIIDDIDPFFDLEGQFFIIRDDDLFRSKPLRKINPSRNRFLAMVGNSSVFRFEFGKHAHILDDYLADPGQAAVEFEHEQQFLSDRVFKDGELRYWPAQWCVSFKNACVPRYLKSFFANPAPPSGARIIVFAGNPKMSEVLAGGGQKWYRRIGNVDWLRRAWMSDSV